MKKYILSIIVFVAGVAAGMLLPRLCPFLRPDADVVTRTDTLTVRDTIREICPVYVENTRTDTMHVSVTDTVTVSDTVYMVLDREQRWYHGDRYDAWVSGYRPQLDSIWVYPETRYVTRTVRPAERRNSIALESSASWCGTWSLTCSLEYDHVFRWCYVGAGVGYDIVARSPYIAVRAGVPIWRW